MDFDIHGGSWPTLSEIPREDSTLLGEGSHSNWRNGHTDVDKFKEEMGNTIYTSIYHCQQASVDANKNH